MGRLTRLTSLAAAGAIMAALLQAPGLTAAGDSVERCPDLQTMSVDQLQPGMKGYGLTVTQGNTPQRFDVEVLGVIEDGLLPGRDMILIEASGDVIDEVGGIWFGMSGSPIYINDKLIGAEAFGFTAGPSPIGGVTPVADMLAVANQPEDATTARSQTVELSPRYQRLAVRHGATEAQAAAGLTQLRLPFSMSGVSGPRLEMIREVADREGLALLPYAGGSASTSSGSSAAAISPGSNFFVTLSTGDLTSGGVGTTTFVCPGLAMAFGHPMLWDGTTGFGVHDAQALAIVSDPTFGNFKFATVGNLGGTIDQDRFAGVRGDLGSVPIPIPVTSTTTALNTGAVREGETQVMSNDFVPTIAFSHAFANIDSTFDQISGGSSTVAWHITGTRAGGEPWELTRSNSYASDFDISIDSTFEFFSHLSQLLDNEFEDVEFTSVEVNPTVDDEIRRLKIDRVLVSVNGGAYRQSKRVEVTPSDRIGLRIVMREGEEGTERTAEMLLKLPRALPKRGVIEVTGGVRGGNFDCLFIPEECVGSEGEVQSFDGLLASLQDSPTNDQLNATLEFGGFVSDQEITQLDQVVGGKKRVRIVYAKGAGGGKGGGGSVVAIEG